MFSFNIKEHGGFEQEKGLISLGWHIFLTYFKNIRTGNILLTFAFNFNWLRVKLEKKNRLFFS